MGEKRRWEKREEGTVTRCSDTVRNVKTHFRLELFAASQIRMKYRLRFEYWNM